MKRVFLFAATNVAVLLVLSVVWNVFGLERVLAEQGVNTDFAFIAIFATVFGMGGAFISLLMSKSAALRMTRAHVIESPRNRTEKWLLDTVRRQAEQAGIGMPDVAIYDAPDLNAFATGSNRDKSLVAVSTGLMQGMSEGEVEAVLAHEVSHVANGDMITLTLIQGVVNTFVIILSRIVGQLVDRVVFKNERGHGPGFWVTTIIAQMVLGILASIIVMWFSRQREFRADAGGAKLAGREKMIAALERLAGSTREPHLPDQMAAFGISGGKSGGLANLLRTHPPLADRIEALRSGA